MTCDCRVTPPTKVSWAVLGRSVCPSAPEDAIQGRRLRGPRASPGSFRLERGSAWSCSAFSVSALAQGAAVSAGRPWRGCSVGCSPFTRGPGKVCRLRRSEPPPPLPPASVLCGVSALMNRHKELLSYFSSSKGISQVLQRFRLAEEAVAGAGAWEVLNALKSC